MFQTIIVKPIFNVLMLIYAIIPGHDLGIAVILLTILTRLILWPMLKKQLHQTKVMQVMQPKIKRIKAQTKGDKQAEAKAMMELYKEHGISPVGSIGVLIVQLPVLFGLFESIRVVTDNPNKIKGLIYPFLNFFPQIKLITNDIGQLQEKLFGVINLTVKPITNGHIYWPLMIMALVATVFQYYQSKQILPIPKEKKSLRQLLKEQSNSDNAPDMSDMNATIGRSTLYLLPGITFIFAISVQGALVLYLLTSAVVGVIQQTYILNKDVIEMEGGDEPKIISKETIGVSEAPNERKKVASTRVSKPPKNRNKSGVTVVVHSPAPNQNIKHKKAKSKKKGR